MERMLTKKDSAIFEYCTAKIPDAFSQIWIKSVSISIAVSMKYKGKGLFYEVKKDSINVRKRRKLLLFN